VNILHVIHNYHPAHGGPQYTMKHLSERMVSGYNDTVTVATSNSLYGPELSVFKEIPQRNEVINGVRVKRFPFRRWHYGLLVFLNKALGKLRGRGLPYSIMKRRWGLDCPGIDNEMKTTDAEVIMATTIQYAFADYPMWRSAAAYPKPFVLYGALHLHVNWPADSPYIKRALACDCYIANTEFERTTLIGYGMPPEKVVTIGTGIEVKDFECDPATAAAFRKQHDIAEDEVLIGYIGRLVKGKGVDVLMEAFRRLYKGNKKIKLLLAGTTTDYIPEIKSFIQQHALPVILIENFKDDNKQVMYHAMDIFVLASKGESFGVVFLEAWACRKPVIGANTGAISTLLSEGVDSLLFTPNDANSLAEQMSVLVNDADKRKMFAENGYRKIIEKYTWEKIVASYRAAYQVGINEFTKRKGN